MKKILCCVLVLASLILSACGSSEIREVEKEVPVIPEEYAAFSSVVDCLLREDYDGAEALIEAMRPLPEPSPVTRVELSLENFFDYFEYTEYRCPFALDAQGGVRTLGVIAGFRLKEGFRLSPDPEQESVCTLSYTFSRHSALLKGLDMEELTWRTAAYAGRYLDDGETRWSSLEIPAEGEPDIPLLRSYYTDASLNRDTYSQYYTDFGLTGVTGTLCLLAD